MTLPPHFDQRDQSVDTQTNIGHVDKVIIKASSSASVLPIPQQIPPPPRDFTGRKDDIKELLENFSQGATITGLRGMGGVGKTALALVFADRLKNRFPDGQLFLNMLGISKNPLKPEDVMAHVIRSYLGVDASLPEQLNGLSGLYRTVLSDKKVLILLDNAASREQVEPLLPPTGCALLVTSRKKFALPDLAEKDLDVLPLEDAKKLLQEIAPRIGDHAEELAKLCGCLPIALRNAAYALKEKLNLSPEGYLERLGDATKRLELVEASFSTSYDLLTPELQRLWSLLSVFPADFDLEGAAAVWEMEEMPAEDALGELIRWSLVDFLPSATGEGGRHRLHDLARDFAGFRLDSDSRELAEQHHSEHYNKVLSVANLIFLQDKKKSLLGLKLFDLENANIFAGQSWAEDSLETNSSAIELSNTYPNVGANILDLRLTPKEKIPWLETGLKASRMKKDVKMEGNHLGNLGIAYHYLGDIRKAIHFYNRILELHREIGDRRGEGADLSNLGLAYSHLGEPRKAIEYYEQALKIAQEIGDRRGVGAILGNLGLTYADLEENRSSIEYHNQALAIAREIGDRRGEGADLGNLGLAHLNLGELRKAIDLSGQALAIAREIGDRRNEGNWVGNLGIAYKELGEPRKAIEFYEQALAIAQEIGDRRGEGNALANLGNAYLHLGEPRKAIKFYEQALKIAQDIVDMRGEGNALGNLGIAYKELGEPCKSIEYHKQALKISRKIEDRRGEGYHLGNLGNACHHLGEIGKAIRFYDQALKIAQEIGDRRGEGKHMGNLGLAYYHLGEPRKAIEFYDQALKIAQEIGDQRGEGADLGNLGLAYYHLGEPRKAIEFYNQALKISKEIGDRRGEGFHLFNMSLSLNALGQQEKAISLARSALEIFEQIESPHAETVRQKLAEWSA